MEPMYILIALLMTATEHELTDHHVLDAITAQDSVILVGYEYVLDSEGNQVDMVLWSKGHVRIEEKTNNYIRQEVVKHERFNTLPFRLLMKDRQYIVYKRKEIADAQYSRHSRDSTN